MPAGRQPLSHPPTLFELRWTGRERGVETDMQQKEFHSLIEMPLSELMEKADKVRSASIGNKLDICTITNAKSGLCSEDCKFCAQSAHHKAEIEVYPLKSKETMVAEAKEAKANGAQRFGIVTSGRGLSKKDLDSVIETVKEITENVGMIACASLGELSEEDLVRLKNAGLKRYHHNIETSRNFYSKITTTHTFDDRLRTIRFAKETGLEVCSGGIIGLGETWQDRIDMALTLKELDVNSVPVNVLVPIEGTPMSGQDNISASDAVRTIAIFRIILPGKTVKLAAGRESKLKDHQAMAYMAGANGMLIGGYLTVKGRSVEDDKKLIKEILSSWEKKTN